MGDAQNRTTRIIVDLQASQMPGSARRGVGNYSTQLFAAMQRSIGNRELFALRSELNPVPIGANLVEPGRCIDLPPFPDFGQLPDYEGGARDSTDSAFYNASVAKLNPDVIHVSHVFEGLSARVALPGAVSKKSGQILSATLYDFIPLRFPGHYFADRRFEKWYRGRMRWLHQADVLFSISESTRQDAIGLAGLDPERIVTIHGGIADGFRLSSDQIVQHRQDQSTRVKYSIRRKGFVLYTGGDEYRKNLVGALSGFAALDSELRANYNLVVVCALTQERRAELQRKARSLGLADDDVLLLGYVPETDLISLYATCDLFLFPSLYEGLGLPVIEAMACGAPVVGGDNSSIREIIGRGEALFDASAPRDVAKTMARVLTDSGLADGLRQFGLSRSRDFSWERSAKLTLEALDHALERSRANGVRAARHGWLPRRRLAFLSPLPPLKSGISDYNSMFLPALSRHFEIDLFVSQEVVSDSNLTSQFPIFGIEDFPRAAAAYDAIQYEFGNSEFHAHMLDLLEAFPGVVGLHDAYLSGMIGYKDFSLGDRGRYEREMLHSHGSQARRLMAPAFGRTDPIFETMVQLPGTKSVLDRALGVISHSPFNLDLARKHFPEGWSAPYRIIPQMVARRSPISAMRRTEIRKKLGYKADDFIVASFGHVAWNKLGDRLVDAFLEATSRNDSNAKLVFAGELAKDDFGERLSKQIASTKLRDRVRVTGFVAQEEYDLYLQVADVAVQLRANSRGGTPKGVLDCLASGVPVIVNNDASYTDYPNDVVTKLSPDPGSAEVAAAIASLRNDASARMRQAARGREYVEVQHDPAECAAQYAAAIHEFIERHQSTTAANQAKILGPYLSTVSPAHNAPEAAARFFSLLPEVRFAQPRLLVDVSHIAQQDNGTGVPRVVRETVKALYGRSKPGLDVVAVRRAGGHLIRATDWLAGQGLLLPSERNDASEQKLCFRPTDHLLMLDSSWGEYHAFEPVFRDARRAGVPITTAVYDLLPLTLPPGNIVDGGREWFENWFRRALAESDSLVAISRAVADEIVEYVKQRDLSREGLKVGYWHLGAEFLKQDTKPSVERRVPYFLVAGTIEPRKNHSLILDAFESLWTSGDPLNLIVAGKEGWMVSDLMARIRRHPEFERRLFLLENPTDEQLASLYRGAAALLFLSKGEGFGLPLVEAARYSTPILCSDIAAFREIAGDHATYVDISSSDAVVSGIRSWQKAAAANTLPESGNIGTLTWDESAEQLVNCVIKQAWYRTF